MTPVEGSKTKNEIKKLIIIDTKLRQLSESKSLNLETVSEIVG